MAVSYDTFTEIFLSKVSEYDFLQMPANNRRDVIDGFMKRACSQFNKICKYDLSKMNDKSRSIDIDIEDKDTEEIVDIVTDGMLVQWMKPFVYKQENLETILNTRDFTTYSPAELLYRVRGAYNEAKNDFVNAMREYSYNHGDLTDLHT